MCKHGLPLLVVALTLLSGRVSGQEGDAKVAALVQQLQRSNNADKIAAAVALADLGPAAAPAVPALVSALQVSDEHVRLNSAIALGKIGAPAVDRVVKLLKNTSPSDRYYAIWTLGWIGPAAKSATPMVIQSLADKDNGVRRKAAYTLGRIAPDAKTAIPPLIQAFADSNEDVRKAAAESLAKFGAESAPALLDALHNESLTLRIEAIRALGSLGSEAKSAIPQLNALFQKGEGKLAFEASDALGKIGKPAVPALADALKSDRPEVRSRAIQVLGKVGADAVPVLVDALADKQADVRVNAASALTPLRMSDKMVVLALAHAVHDTDARVRQQSLRALQMLGSGAKLASPKLVEALKSESTQERLQVLNVLQNIGEDEKNIVPAAAELLKDGNASVRQAAVSLLGSQGASALSHLIAALKDTDTNVRFTAVNALQRVPGDIKEALPALVPILTQASPFQRRNVVTLLGRMGEPAVPHLLDLVKKSPDSFTRSLAISALGSIGPEAKKATPTLIKSALQDNYIAARRNAIQAIAAIEPDALSELFAKVRKHNDEKTRQAIYGALMGQVGKKTFGPAMPAKLVVPHLIEATKDTSANVRFVALQGLANLGPDAKDAVPAVTALVDDSDPRVRNQAKTTLQRIKGT
jgi:HEAT repeat protein